MLLQRTLFSGPRAWVNEDLYAKNTRGMAYRTRQSVHVEPGGRVTTNTYFGRFAAAYWQRWTRVQSVEVTGEVTAAENDVTTILLRGSDIGAHQRTIREAVVTGSGRFTLTAPLNMFFDGGAMWLDFAALDGAVEVSNVEWHVKDVATSAGDASDVPEEPNRRFAIAVCTYNRPTDCAATVSALANDEVVRGLIDELYVTDQGDQLVSEQEEFTEAAATFGGAMHYIQQPNLGGAGGFTRGIFEATAETFGGSPVDVLLMDDDVRVEPETVLRMRAFANYTNTPTLVGAQMLFLFNPDYLLASAEGVDLGTLRRGTKTDRHGVTNTSMVDEELPERRVDAEYNGWWSCLIPSEAVEQMGLPIPFFFQWDDVEYGLRGRRHGIPTVTLPGAAVWHADFYWKDVDGFGHFFSMRNGLITAALDPRFDPKALTESTLTDIQREILGMQYGLAYTHMEAVRGFLAGPEALHDGGQQAVKDINKGRAQFPETRTIPLIELPPVVRVARAFPPPDGKMEKLVLAKRRLKSRLRRRIPGPTFLPYEDSPWYNASLYSDIYVTDASQTAVRHRTYRPELERQQLRELKKLMRQFRRHAKRTSEAYQKAFPELIARENWARLYNADAE